MRTVKLTLAVGASIFIGGCSSLPDTPYHQDRKNTPTQVKWNAPAEEHTRISYLARALATRDTARNITARVSDSDYKAWSADDYGTARLPQCLQTAMWAASALQPE